MLNKKQNILIKEKVKNQKVRKAGAVSFSLFFLGLSFCVTTHNCVFQFILRTSESHTTSVSVHTLRSCICLSLRPPKHPHAQSGKQLLARYKATEPTTQCTGRKKTTQACEPNYSRRADTGAHFP